MQSHYDEFVETFKHWAQTQDDIRCARLIGSRTTLEKPSRYVDLDIEFYTTKPLYYRTTWDWIGAVCPTWLITPDDRGEVLYHWSARWRSWVLFTTLDNGIAVDFMIQPYLKLIWFNRIRRLRGNLKPVTSEYILIDKDNQLTQWGAIPPPPQGTICQPSQADYLWCVHEFWGLSDRAIRYLRRGYDIESRRMLGDALRRQITQMMLWYAGANANWDTNRDWRMHHIDQWADPKHIEAFRQCYASYDLDDVIKATLASFDLFRSVAIDVAQMLDYPYPHDEDKYISNWIKAELNNSDN